MIQKAMQNNIHDIEEILYDAVIWMRQNNISNLWNEKNILWSELSKDYNISDFYIYYLNNKPVGCMALTSVDAKYWSDIEADTSIYLHKLAVKREASGCGISKALIDFAKSYTKNNNIPYLRLDCNKKQQKLRSIYEKSGFIYNKTVTNNKGYKLALYTYNL